MSLTANFSQQPRAPQRIAPEQISPEPIALTPSGPRFPVLDNVLGGFGDVAGNWRLLAGLAQGWFALIAATSLLTFLLVVCVPSMFETGNPYLAVLMIWLPTVATALATYSITVSWHRYVLIGEEPPRGLFRLDRMVRRYIVAALCYAALAGAIGGLVGTIVPLIEKALGLAGGDPSVRGVLQPGAEQNLDAFTLGYKLVIYYSIGFFVAARFVTLLPKVALGERLSFRTAFQETRGNTLRIGAGLFLIFAAVIMVQGVNGVLLDLKVRAADGTLLWPGIVGFGLASVLTSFVILVIGIAGTSYINRVYRFLHPGQAAVSMGTSV